MVAATQTGVEYHMRFHDIVQRLAAESERPAPGLGPYLAVSRLPGSRGTEVARRVANRLGWNVLDRQLVEDLAERLKLSPRLLELMDETRTDWLRETLLNLVEPRLVEQHGYVALLGRVMLVAASEGRVVFVGRGAGFLLPPEAGIRVQVVASREYRLRTVAEREGIDGRVASRRLDSLDADRATFLHRNFGREPADVDDHDLTVNTGTLGIDGASELVCRALELRGLAEWRQASESLSDHVGH